MKKPTLAQDIVKFLMIVSFTMLFLILLAVLTGCETTQGRAERICKYFGGLRNVGEELVTCRDGSVWQK